MSLIERDKARVWHPFTQQKTAPDPLAIARGEGAYLIDVDGNRYLDLISSWWVNLHGHAHPDIARAIYQQASTLEHVLFAGCTHEPAVRLCEQLQSILPHNLCRFFYSDNGSTAVEVALKMALQFWVNQTGEVRPYFLSFAGGYHGDTFGAMSVGAQSGYFDPFKSHFFEVLSISYPDTWEGDDAVETKEQIALLELDAHLVRHAKHIAAIILEPLVQGASGMRMCRSQFINAVIERVRAAGILVIFDEVMTGFARTGTYFALEQLQHTPDLLCISKGLTGGFLPLALTITTEAIHSAFLSDRDAHAFLHGHSYTANPIACAAALMSFDLLTRPDCATNRILIHQSLVIGMQRLQARCKGVQRVRIRGSIAAFELKLQKNTLELFKQACKRSGILVRPLGNTVYLIPPYVITPAEIGHVFAVFECVLLDDSIDSHVKELTSCQTTTFNLV